MVLLLKSKSEVKELPKLKLLQQSLLTSSKFRSGMQLRASQLEKISAEHTQVLINPELKKAELD